jgi:hypothetical protein
MAEGSPLPFPSPSAILGDAVSANPTDRDGEVPKKHIRKQSRETKKEPLPPRKAPTLDDPSKDASAVKPKQTKSRNGKSSHPSTLCIHTHHRIHLPQLCTSCSKPSIKDVNTDNKLSYQAASHAKRNASSAEKRSQTVRIV